jgi:hypothetical protein
MRQKLYASITTNPLAHAGENPLSYQKLFTALLSVHRVVESQYIILNRCLRRDCQASVRYKWYSLFRSANQRSRVVPLVQPFAHHSSFRSSQATNCENLAPDTVNAIVKQLRELQSHPAEGISVSDPSTFSNRFSFRHGSGSFLSG